MVLQNYDLVVLCYNYVLFYWICLENIVLFVENPYFYQYYYQKSIHLIFVVKLNEDDDKQRSQDSSSAVATTNEAGKTVTE